MLQYLHHDKTCAHRKDSQATCDCGLNDVLESYRVALAATHPQPQKCERSLTIRYTNYRGETSDRSIEPGRIYFGSTEWHPEEQWLLEAFDFDRKAGRTFALKDIQWKTKAYASSREQK